MALIDTGLLILRIGLGGIFLYHGLPKLMKPGMVAKMMKWGTAAVFFLGLVEVLSGLAVLLGFFAELGALKGEMPKVEFESIRGIGQQDIDEMFNMVKDSPLLGEWDKINARQGLIKLLGTEGGKIPTQKELVLVMVLAAG